MCKKALPVQISKFQYSTSRLGIYGLSILTDASANSSLLAEYAGWLLIAI
jgi:hypothetical protein